MWRTYLQDVIHLIFPPHPDVQQASQVRSEEILSNLSFTYHAEYSTYTALLYKNQQVRSLIKANKFYKDTHAAKVLGAVLGELLVGIVEEQQILFGTLRPLIIPIPSSKKRLHERGGNQVEWIIHDAPKEILSGFDYAPHVLKREHRKSQARLSKKMRHTNIRGAFFVHETRAVSKRHIVLVDDVIETGATMSDAMRTLYKAGALSVTGAVIAK